jgi:hypothetical protein
VVASLDAVAAESTDKTTRLTFDVRDDAEMWGIMERLGDLGLQVTAIDTDQEPALDADAPRGQADSDTGSR